MEGTEDLAGDRPYPLHIHLFAFSAEICPRNPNTLLPRLRGVLNLDHFKLHRLSVARVCAYGDAFALVRLELLRIVPIKIDVRPQGSLQNRPYGVTSKAAMGKFPELRCCTLPFAFWASLICEISRWGPISSSKVEKISLR